MGIIRDGCSPTLHIQTLIDSVLLQQRTVILPTDHLATKLGMKTHWLPSMIQVKHVLADLAGVVLVLAYHLQRIVHQDHLPYRPITFSHMTRVVAACKSVSLDLLDVRLHTAPVGPLWRHLCLLLQSRVIWMWMLHLAQCWEIQWLLGCWLLKCTKDCDLADGPPYSEIDHQVVSAPIFATPRECCILILWIAPDVCVSDSESSVSYTTTKMSRY